MRMYSDYFGIRENAFAITPDPRYLFMSERHREALAHLLFGTEEGGGFVQLTGEVGTGKTTICRAFLEQLPANVDVALLLNPPESARELLLAIASELRLPVKNREAQVRELVELLNRRLLEAHAAGRRTVVIIDEAQNIRSNVLEQVRLLTNLETATHKLLQVFLIGQPELRQKLEHPALRQVAQRITARYHLEPLSLPETRGYILHRLAVAGCRQGLFTPAAIKQIYRQSQGIPRVINILCDRALIGAFATDSVEVTTAIVRYAAREWRGETGKNKRMRQLLRPALAVGVAGLMLAAAAGFAGNTAMQPANGLAALVQEGMQRVAAFISRLPPIFIVPESTASEDVPADSVNPETAMTSSENQTSPPASNAEEPVSPHKPGGTVAVAAAFPELVHLAAATEADRTGGARWIIETAAPIALQALLANWGIYAAPPDRPALCDQVIGHGLRCLRERGSWNTLRAYNRPALLTLKAKEGRERYLALVGLRGDKAMVATTEGVRQLPIEQLEAYWNGEYVILWRPPLAGISLIGPGSASWAVEWLQQTLSRVDGEAPAGNQHRTLEQRLRHFQRSRGLLADGIAGPRTLIQLNTLLGKRNFPVLALAQGETR